MGILSMKDLADKGEEVGKKEIINSKFRDGEIVKTSPKHHSQISFVMLENPHNTDNRGWVYEIRYINRQGRGGGSSMWWGEDEFEKLINPTDILYAERLTRLIAIERLKMELQKNCEELGKVEYCLKITVPDWDKVEESCNRCGKLFHTHGKGGDYNRGICIDCDNLTKE